MPWVVSFIDDWIASGVSRWYIEVDGGMISDIYSLADPGEVGALESDATPDAEFWLILRSIQGRA